MQRISKQITLLLTALICATAARAALETEKLDSNVEIVISVADQRMAILCDGDLVTRFPISTSRFGIGDNLGSYRTPLGKLKVCDKIGDGLPAGAVIHHRAATGEVLSVNAPGRDPIVSRILWLDGTEEENRNAKARSIYIHGTPEERSLGKPVSWGCIRMRSKDVMELYDVLPMGASVTIISEKLPHYSKYTPPPPPPPAPAPAEPLIANQKAGSKAPAGAPAATKNLAQTKPTPPAAPTSTLASTASAKPAVPTRISNSPLPFFLSFTTTNSKHMAPPPIGELSESNPSRPNARTSPQDATRFVTIKGNGAFNGNLALSDLVFGLPSSRSATALPLETAKPAKTAEIPNLPSIDWEPQNFAIEASAASLESAPSLPFEDTSLDLLVSGAALENVGLHFEEPIDSSNGVAVRKAPTVKLRSRKE